MESFYKPIDRIHQVLLGFRQLPAILEKAGYGLYLIGLLPIYLDREERGGRPLRKPCPPFSISILRDPSYLGFQASRTRNRRLETRREEGQ